MKRRTRVFSSSVLFSVNKTRTATKVLPSERERERDDGAMEIDKALGTTAYRTVSLLDSVRFFVPSRRLKFYAYRAAVNNFTIVLA